MSTDNGDKNGNQETGDQEQGNNKQDSLDSWLMRSAKTLAIVSTIWILIGLFTWKAVVKTINGSSCWVWEEVGIYFISVAAWFGVLAILVYAAILLVKLAREY